MKSSWPYILLCLLLIIPAGCATKTENGITPKQPVAPGEVFYRIVFIVEGKNSKHDFEDYIYIYQGKVDNRIKIRYLHNKSGSIKKDQTEYARLDKNNEVSIETPAYIKDDAKSAPFLLIHVNDQQKITVKPLPYASPDTQKIVHDDDTRIL